MSDAPPEPARQAQLIELAQQQEASDWAGALERLLSANRSERCDELEVAIAQLRRRGWDHLPADPPSAPSPPSTAPPVGERGLPEASLATLDASEIRAAIARHGSLLVPSAIPMDAVERLHHVIDESISAHEHWLDQRGERRAGRASWSSSWWNPLEVTQDEAWGLRRGWVYGGGGVLLADAPRALFEVLELYEELGLRQLVEDFLGERPVLSANKCTLRRVPTDAGSGWHQDGAFLGPGIRALNIWVALDRCGVDAPGLDLVPRRFEEIVETGTGSTFFEWGTGEEAVERASGEIGVVRPVFEPGDLLFFDDLCLHRTATEPEMDKPRHAIELWSFAPSAYPADQVPVVW